MRRRTRAHASVVVVALTLPVFASCTSSKDAKRAELTIVVSVPVVSQPWVAQFAERGARLAADEINAAGGVADHGGHARIKVELQDNGGSAQRAVAIARSAASSHALAIITDGTGAKAVAAVTDPMQLPVFVVFDGDQSLTDAKLRPTLFRIAPANKPMATRLADYVAAKKPKVAVIADTTQFGSGGAAALDVAFARDKIQVTSRQSVSSTAADLTGAVSKARRSGADTLVIWASSTVVAAGVRAARSAEWTAPIFTGPTGEDPVVRQLLADHPTWLDGTRFVSFRITAEVGPKPFESFRAKYEKLFGVEKVGVTADGRAVTVPPDWAMYGYDSVRLVAKAYENAGSKLGPPLAAEMESTVITGANGDERGFGPEQREGVSPDDMYFGLFKSMRFAPVTDDILSTNLPAVPQG